MAEDDKKKPDPVAEALAETAAVNAEIAAELEKFVPLSEEHQRQINRFLKDDMPIHTDEEQRRTKAYALWQAIRYRLRTKGS